MRSFDLLIIGAGSGNSVIGPEYEGWDIAIAEHGSFGGTCLNAGCIPSKMLVYTAELAELARDGKRFGVRTRVDGVDWPAIRERVFNRIDPIAEAGRQYRRRLPNVTVFEHSARFVGPGRVIVDNEVVSAERIVVAAGARPGVPPIPGLGECGYHTSDTIMRLDSLPERLLVIGGGYIATELGGVFGALGSNVTFLLRGDTFLRREDDDISARFTDAYKAKFDVRQRTRVLDARLDDDKIVLTVSRIGAAKGSTANFNTTRNSSGDSGMTDSGASSELRGDALLVATGRVPNADLLDTAAAGIDTDSHGYIVTDEQCRTTAPGVWALGDVANPVQLKHVANHEARVVRHNLIHPEDPATVDHRFIPHAVFCHPQVASVGFTERDCRLQGIPHVSRVHPYSAAAYGWALEDTVSVVKVIADPETRLLLGAHIIGPQASTLIQQLIQGMRFGLTVDQMARQQYYVHPALPEVVEQALLEL